MKRVVFGIFLFCVCVTPIFAQGSFFFDTSAFIGPIEYTTDLSTFTRFPVGNPATLPGFGPLTVAFMAAPDGTPLTVDSYGRPNFSAAWTQADTVVTRIFPGPGDVISTLITLPASAGAPGVNDELSIVAWTGTATSWQDALNGDATMLGWTGSTLSGGALEWSQPTGPSSDPLVPIPPVVRGQFFGYNGLVLAPVPDAFSTLSLISVGLATLVLFQFSTRYHGSEAGPK